MSAKNSPIEQNFKTSCIKYLSPLIEAKMDQLVLHWTLIVKGVKFFQTEDGKRSPIY